ncbi:MAG TPA: hypothetical protein PK307_07865 [Spirochaetota bacterium]|nr:hypothetical protein [Spirochaetota bacterium]HOD13346.1 hypothetical protein [Spirochaetota bacterium]HPG51830.1 hypothetical protein [Spirochaetota bacterium]HPN13521.1 hypothetical protein [Spirochaetota bacterium]HQL82103.1 hypothetical protein [Spirochaetota bacterium]
MNREQKDDYELIAKHCPDCKSLVMAKVEKQATGTMRYNGYKCSSCDWASPGCATASK